MQRFGLVGIFFALFFAIVGIGAWWSHDRAVQPAVTPDTTSTPNPDAKVK